VQGHGVVRASSEEDFKRVHPGGEYRGPITVKFQL